MNVSAFPAIHKHVNWILPVILLVTLSACQSAIVEESFDTTEETSDFLRAQSRNAELQELTLHCPAHLSFPREGFERLRVLRISYHGCEWRELPRTIKFYGLEFLKSLESFTLEGRNSKEFRETRFFHGLGALQELPALKKITVRNTSMYDFQNIIVPCPHLEEVYLEYNSIRTIPASVASMHKLRILRLHESLVEIHPNLIEKLYPRLERFGWLSASLMDLKPYEVTAPSGLRLRRSPATDSEVFRVLEKGAVVYLMYDTGIKGTFEGKQGVWLYVAYPFHESRSTQGYVFSGWLKETERPPW